MENEKNKDPFFEKLQLTDFSKQDDYEDIEEPVDLVPLDTTTNSILEADIEYVRTNLKTMIKEGKGALKDVTDLSYQSQSARGYEVVARMMEVLLKANRDLSDLTFQRKAETPSTPQNITNNNLFVGTTEDAMRMIRGEDDE